MQCKTPGDVLRRLRLDRGLTQQAVADALHINRSTYSFHESGKTQLDLQRVAALSTIFDIPLECLVELLSNPEKMEHVAEKKRASRKVSVQPIQLGQLRPEEKSLIAVFRRCDSAGQRDIYLAAKEKMRSC